MLVTVMAVAVTMLMAMARATAVGMGAVGRQIDDLGVKRLAKTAEYFRWRDDDELLEAIGVGMQIKRLGKRVGKPFLCEVVPVDFFHAASPDAKTCERAPRP